MKFYIEASLLLVCGGMKVRERLGIGGWARFSRDAEGFERGHRRNPGSDGGGEVFREEGSERLVLPGLNVAGGPVVEQTDAEEVMRRFRDGNGSAQQAGLADIKRQFQFIIQCLGGKEIRLAFRRRWARLPCRTEERDSAGEDGGGAAVIADRDVFVVGEQRLIGAEEPADAGGVMDGGVEVRVVGDVNRFDESGAGDGVKRGFGRLPAVWFGAGAEERDEGFAKQRP